MEEIMEEIDERKRKSAVAIRSRGPRQSLRQRKRAVAQR
jgi:hypothetical protein